MINDRTIHSVSNDIFKALEADGLAKERDREDITQTVTLVYLELEQRNNEEPSPGYLYKTAFYECRRLFVQSTAKLTDTRIYFKDQADIPVQEDLSTPDRLYEEKEAIEQSEHLREILNNYGIEIDDPCGPEFALWYLGLSCTEIGLTLLAAGLKPTKRRWVEENIRKTCKEIERKTGITPQALRILRDENLQTTNKTTVL
jgi:hypothetical protein